MPLADERDGVLAIAASVGNLDAFAELVRRYRRAAVRVAGNIVGQDSAEDVAQEALLLAFKALPDLDEPDHFAAWLSAITRNRALRWLKREQRAIHIEFDDALRSSLEMIASQSAPDREVVSELYAGLDQLPEACRLVMRLRWLDEMPMQKIAAFTGLPLSTVKWRLHEGKRKLREWSRENVRKHSTHQHAINNQGESQNGTRTGNTTGKRNSTAAECAAPDGAHGTHELLDERR